MLRKILIFLALIQVPTVSYACSCALTTRDEILERADAVGIVHVEKIVALNREQKKQAQSEGILSLNEAFFRTQKMTKGTLPPTFKAVAEDWSLFCGIPLEKGTTKEVAFIRLKSGWATMDCQHALTGAGESRY